MTFRMLFKDSPEPCSPGTEEKVMHATLQIGDSNVLVSDGRCSGKASLQGFSLPLPCPAMPKRSVCSRPWPTVGRFKCR